MIAPRVGPAEHPYDWAVRGPPIGRWDTYGDNIHMLMGSQVVFAPDGTGHWQQRSTLEGQSGPCPFLWRFEGPGRLRTFEPVEGEEDDPDNDPARDESWGHLTYKADWHPNVPKMPILINDVGAHSSLAGQFWFLQFPVKLAGRV